MGQQNASLAVTQRTKDDLDENYYASEYPSQDALVSGMLAALPTQDQIQDGCSQCDKPFRTTRFEELNAVVHVFYSDEHDARNTRIFCSESCFSDAREKERSNFPRDPELVAVGGKDELRATLEDARFIIDGSDMWVSLDVPGAFGGTDDLGNDYDYVGEPVFIQNDDGDWVQDGIVENIIHEEAHTALTLDTFGGTPDLYHPDPEVREEFKENSFVCPECESRYRYYEHTELPFDCPECGNPIPEHAADDQ